MRGWKADNFYFLNVQISAVPPSERSECTPPSDTEEEAEMQSASMDYGAILSAVHPAPSAPVCVS
jgi:hypothetical protein